MNTGQVGDKSGRRHPTRRQVESATSNSATTAVNSATTSVKSATFANRIGDNFGHIGDNFWSNEMGSGLNNRGTGICKEAYTYRNKVNEAKVN